MTDEYISLLRTKKKPMYPIGPGLRSYLLRYGRDVELPVVYEELFNYNESMPLFDDDGEDTLWQTCIYPPHERERLSRELTKIYAILKSGGDITFTEHLYLDRIDYCTFGNSHPFRIRIVNSYNDNQDYYYIKGADASRVYGLELEHLLSPNRIHYLTSSQTLVEEHIVGIPGDVFIQDWLKNSLLNEVRLAKELVKFNERCFIRLLGDMRAYNYVVDITPDFEEAQIRIRAMDFDQQSYSGRRNFYLPQFFKDNNPLVFFCLKHLNLKTSRQYQLEERALIYRRIQIVEQRLRSLLECMCADRIAPDVKVQQLGESLADYYKNDQFLSCESMGEIVWESLSTMIHSVREPGKSVFSQVLHG